MQGKAQQTEVHAGRSRLRSNLSDVNLLGRKKDNAQPDSEGTGADVSDVAEEYRGTAPKGRPTPKRDTAKRRGPVAPAPKTSAEARARRKSLAGPKLSRGERKVDKAERRERTAARRARMMAGEEAYLLPRDQGPVRRFARDLVDSRRNFLGLFMPAALGLIFVMLAIPSPQIQAYISPAMLLLVAVMAIDGFILARRVNSLVDQKFPDNTEKSWKLGFYAAGRASQLRRMRAPKPQVDRGASVA